MKEEITQKMIQEGLKNLDKEYKGFNMSGYGTTEKSCNLENAEVLEIIKDAVLATEEKRILPFQLIFWKGVGTLFDFDGTEIKSYEGKSSEEILMDIVKLKNKE